jgi:hypothetical protein
MDRILSSVDELQLRENASRGAGIFDEEISEWYWEISLEKLEMSDPPVCIAGQIGWYRVRAIMDRRQILPSEMGLVRLNFGSTHNRWEEEYLEEYGILKDQWECEIRRRRDADGTREHGTQE